MKALNSLAVTDEHKQELTNPWSEEKKTLGWDDLKKLPNGLGETILEQFMSDFEFVKWTLTREEAINYINAVGIEAECCIYGIHGWKASLSLNNPMCLYWNVYDIKNFQAVFHKSLNQLKEAK